MAGTWLDQTGTALGHNNYVRVLHFRAYDEGVQYRMAGTALQQPATGNPHPAGTPANVLWSTGWTDAHGDGLGANGTVDASSAYRGQTAPA